MRPLLTIAATLLALTACGSGGDHPCTLIGTDPGLSIDIKAPDAARVASASLRVCWSAKCQEPKVVLQPSSTSVPQGCDGDTCGASASPDGGKHGFVRVEGLPKSSVRVTLQLRDARGRTFLDRTLDLTPEATFPNGRNCGEGAPQSGLIVTAGTVTVR